MHARKLLLNVLMAAVFITCFTLGTAHAQGEPPDLTRWVGTWFKLTLTANVYHYSNIGVKPSPSYRVTDAESGIYMKIAGWDAGTRILQATAYPKEGGVYSPLVSIPLDMNYFAGDGLKFVCSSFVDEAGMQNGFILFFKGKLNTAGDFVLGGETNFKSLGGYYLETDDVPGSTERWAGSATLVGKMIPLSKVPSILLP